MSSLSKSDLATDLVGSVVLGAGMACWGGLVLAQLGWFHGAAVAGLGVGSWLASLALLRRSRAADGGGARWRSLDGPAVFLAAALLYGQAYDTTLYGADATVYLASGAHVVRTGSLAVEDELLRHLAPIEQLAIFGAYGIGRDDPLSRSPAGLVFNHFSPPVYSTFSQLPAIWLAIGFAVGGLAGALLAPPLLAAAGVTCFYLFVRRLGGVPMALVAAALLAPALPQLTFARLPMGEGGAQFFLWGGLLAYACYGDTRHPVAALAAGLALGLAALARPEYVLFIPLALVTLVALGGRPGRLPIPTIVVTGALLVHAAILVLVVVPTHYRIAIRDTVQVAQRLASEGAGQAPLVALVAAVAVAAIGVAALARSRVGAARRALRALAVVAVAAWALVYVYIANPSSVGQGLPRLMTYVVWPVLLLALPGLVALGRSWWPDPAGRLALLLGTIAAAHFVYDPHTGPLAVWGARRLLPSTLPVLFAAAAAASMAVVRLWRPAALLVAGLVVLSAWPSRALHGRPYLQGTHAAVADIASLLSPGAVVMVGAGIGDALLDVPLLLIHGQSAVQLRGSAGDVGPIRSLLRAAGDRPLYVLEHALLPAPTKKGLRFEPVGERTARLLLPRPARGRRGIVYTNLRVRAYRVEEIRRRPRAG